MSDYHTHDIQHICEKPIKILLTGGGSGGPTQPLLALAEEIKKQNIRSEFLFLGSKNAADRIIVEKSKIKFISVPSGKMRRYWSWKNFLDPILILLGGFFGFFHLINFRPQIVISAGSYVSVPIAYSAWILRLPHIILQMDIRPGLANLLMAPVSKVLFYYFEITASHFPSIPLKHKIGPVVRNGIYKSNSERANKIFGLDPKKPVILVTGGGQGSTGLNEVVSPFFKYWITDFQIVHLTGSNSKKEIFSENLNFNHQDYHRIETVHEGMGDLINRSDIVFSRAGMGILGELSVLKKDSILIPLPGTHQEENAKYFQSKKAAIFIGQDNLKCQGMKWWELYLKKRVPGENGERLKNIFPHGGTKKFAEVVFEIINDG